MCSSSKATWLIYLLNSHARSQHPHSLQEHSTFFPLSKQQHALVNIPHWLLPVPSLHSPHLHTCAHEILFLLTGGKKWSAIYLAPSMGVLIHRGIPESICLFLLTDRMVTAGTLSVCQPAPTLRILPQPSVSWALTKHLLISISPSMPLASQL